MKYQIIKLTNQLITQLIGCSDGEFVDMITHAVSSGEHVEFGDEYDNED